MFDDQYGEQMTRVRASAPTLDIPVDECVTLGPLDPCTIVIFGASGDLTARKLVPALYNLSLHDALPISWLSDLDSAHQSWSSTRS